MVPNGGWEKGDVADRIEANPVVDHLLALLGEKLSQERHQTGNLIRRPIPVLGGEGVERETGNPRFPGAGDDFFSRHRPLPVPLQPGKAALLRPAAVAVHDNRDMSGERFFGGGGHRANFPLPFEDFFFFLGHSLIHLGNKLVVEFLDLGGDFF